MGPLCGALSIDNKNLRSNGGSHNLSRVVWNGHFDNKTYDLDNKTYDHFARTGD